MTSQTKQYIVLFLLLVVGIATRFLFILDGESVLPNFSAVGAVAIFGAFYFKGALRFVAPLAILWLSDIILNNAVYGQYYDSFQYFGSMAVYSAFIVCGLIAYRMMQRPSWLRLFSTSIATGIIFFLITNAASWYANPAYPQTISGLMMSYEAGIPFFRNTILSNLVFSFVFFGIYEFVATRTFSLDRRITALFA